MKTFIYTTHETSQYCHVSVYRIKRNKPVFTGGFKYQFGAHRGEKTEVFRYLAKQKAIAQKHYKENSSYHEKVKDKTGINIIKLDK